MNRMRNREYKLIVIWRGIGRKEEKEKGIRRRIRKLEYEATQTFNTKWALNKGLSSKLTSVNLCIVIYYLCNKKIFV